MYYVVVSTEDLDEASDRTSSLVEVWKMYKNAQEADKMFHIGQKYCVLKVTEENRHANYVTGKVYRRGNKIYFRAI